MLLDLYFSTTIASITIDFIKCFAVRKSLLKKGYTFSSKMTGIHLTDMFELLYDLFFPGANICNAYQLLCTKEKELEDELLRRGTIYKPEDSFEQTELPVKEEGTKVQTATRAKTYEDMTIAEKRDALLKERERLLNDLVTTEGKLGALRK